MKGFIKKENYRFILKSLPVVCVDLIIVKDNKFLLGKRTEEPAKGKWYPVGGRVFKNESLISAVVRKAKEELDLEINPRKAKFLGVGETMFKKSYGSHTINLIYKVPISKTDSVHVKKEHHTEVEWFDNVGKKWDDYVQYALYLAGFK